MSSKFSEEMVKILFQTTSLCKKLILKMSQLKYSSPYRPEEGQEHALEKISFLQSEAVRKSLHVYRSS